MTIKVLVADDHPIIRNAIKVALSDDPDIHVVGEAGDGLEAEEQALKVNPALIIMDIYMPHRNGVESMISIKQRLPDIKFLFLTVSELEHDLLQAIRFGADGYLLKKSDIADVVNAVRRLISGECILSPSVTTSIMKEIKGEKTRFDLSTRESQVLDLVAQGLSNSEIGERLFITDGTVSTYVYRLLQKMHLKNRAEAIAYYHRQNNGPQPF